jgi:hypothetical protein
MVEYEKHGKTGRASMMAGMDRSTGRKYLREGVLPSQNSQVDRSYRTRKDPFEADWTRVSTMLRDAPGLESKALFGWLQEQYPGRYEPGQLRSLQRKIKQWRAMEGPNREVFFGQEHRPGEALQVDFTNCNELQITINGDPFEHLLFHAVLPFCNWEWGTVCRSESLLALRRGVQSTLFRLGHVPQYLQTDSLSAATHELGSGGRAFNEQYEEFVTHFKMKPRRIAVGKCNQNGDVEALNGVLKRCLAQYLLLRGDRDFDSVEAYEEWVQDVLSKNNQQRQKKFIEELKTMRELSVDRLREYKDETVHVTRESTIRIMQNTYSVPSRLIGEKVKVRIYEDRLEVHYGGQRQMSVERLLGRSNYRVDYRHIIWSLVQKPGAFSRYKYREELFPGLVFRQAYDRLCEHFDNGYKADLEYLRILHRAASVSESDVVTALEILSAEKELPLADSVKSLVQPAEAEIPAMVPYDACLDDYDELLEEVLP